MILGSTLWPYLALLLMHLGREPTIVVSSAELDREIMTTHDIIFANKPNSSIASKLLHDYRDLSLSSYGEYWRQMRSICVVNLLSKKKVRSFRSIREEETALMIKKIEEFSPVDLSAMLASFTNDVISRVAFGRKYSEGENGRKFKVLLEELAFLLGVFNVGDFIPLLSWLNNFTGLNARVEKNFREFDHFLDEVVDNHIANRSATSGIIRKDPMDFVDVLLEIQKDGRIDVYMGRDNIKAIILDMFGGGADTTYSDIEWAMTELLRHPESMKKAQKEVREIIGSKPNIPEDDIAEMRYLKAVIKVTLRLHPPVRMLLPRKSSEDVQVGGYDISAKTRVIINAWAIGREPVYWKKAEKFRPKRFSGSSIGFERHDFEFIPFGAGRRGCPGTAFAIANVELVLASLLHKFNWALPGGARGEDLDTSEVAGITIHRKFPLVVVATPHS